MLKIKKEKSKNLNRKNINILKTFPDLPNDTYFASGFETQFVLIIPSKKILVVRMGCTRGDTRAESEYEINMYVSRVLKAIPSS